MYTEAFLFVGNLLQNGLVEKIEFGKKKFKVLFKGEEKPFKYHYDKTDIEYFLEMYEIVESKNK